MKGDVRIENVDFGYYEDRMVLHKCRFFANYQGKKLHSLAQPEPVKLQLQT